MILNLAVPGNRKFRIMMAQPGDGRGGAEAKEEGEEAQRQNYQRMYIQTCFTIT